MNSIFLALALALPFKYTFGPEKAPRYTRVVGFGLDYGTTRETGKPFYFSVAVPEGNFKVTVGLGDSGEACSTMVKAESRRLMLDEVRTAAGHIEFRTFIVNVRNNKLTAPAVN